uniref:Uncharacterized protein n=1 Tax=Anas platyrhynchos platyrhynchos TaxID=8840 RepID=A0A493TZJ6_ANAPP
MNLLAVEKSGSNTVLYNTVITAVVHFIQSRKQLRNILDIFHNAKFLIYLHIFIQPLFSCFLPLYFFMNFSK